MREQQLPQKGVIGIITIFDQSVLGLLEQIRSSKVDFYGPVHIVAFRQRAFGSKRVLDSFLEIARLHIDMAVFLPHQRDAISPLSCAHRCSPHHLKSPGRSYSPQFTEIALAMISSS